MIIYDKTLNRDRCECGCFGIGNISQKYTKVYFYWVLHCVKCGCQYFVFSPITGHSNIPIVYYWMEKKL